MRVLPLARVRCVRVGSLLIEWSAAGRTRWCGAGARVATSEQPWVRRARCYLQPTPDGRSRAETRPAGAHSHKIPHLPWARLAWAEMEVMSRQLIISLALRACRRHHLFLLLFGRGNSLSPVGTLHPARTLSRNSQQSYERDRKLTRLDICE
jgi:hypothetical protein